MAELAPAAPGVAALNRTTRSSFVDMAACPLCEPDRLVRAWLFRLLLRICRYLCPVLARCGPRHESRDGPSSSRNGFTGGVMRIGYDTTALAVPQSGVGVYTA